MHSMRHTVESCLKPIAGIVRCALPGIISLLAACATQIQPGPSPAPARPAIAAPPVSTAEQEALRTLVSLQDRLYRVGAPLLVNNTDLCKGNARNLLGFTAKNKYSYSAEFIEAAHQVLGLNDRLQVMGVLAGSSAAKAGVRLGDGLVSVEDKPLPQGQNAEREAASILAPLVNGKAGVKLSLQRGGANLALNVPLTHACAFAIELGNTDQVNAYADGHRMMITRGMLDFVRSDEELAYVLAREMAHNALAHPQKQRMSATVGGIIDNLIRMHPDLNGMTGMSGIKPMPQAMDTAADTLALYMAARAGYSIDQAPAFWQRMASEYPAATLNGYNAIHPSVKQRLETIDKTLAAIKHKKAAGKPLSP